MFRLFCLLFMVLFLHGCAFIDSMNSDLAQKIDEWVNQHEYARALNTLDYVSPSHADYKNLVTKKRIVLEQAVKYEKTTIKKALNAEQNSRWNEADNIYIEAIDKLPVGNSLEKKYSEFLQRREQHLENLQCELALNNGKWLIETRPVQQQMLKTRPDDITLQYYYQELSDRITSTSKTLLNCSEKSLSKKNERQAETYLETINDLAADNINKDRVNKIRQQLSKTHKKYLRQQNNKTRELISELKQGYSHDNLLRAQQHLSMLRTSGSQNKQAQKLSQLMDKGIKNRIESGRRLYSRGKIQDALSIWEPLQEIAPNDAKLENYIKRARRVLAKVKKLSNKPSATTLPAQ